MAEDTGGEKSLPASGRKIQRAREDGNIAKSQDLTSGIALALALLALLVLGRQMTVVLVDSFAYYVGNAPELTPERIPVQALAWSAVYRMGWCVLPFMLTMVVGGLLVNFGQVGFLLTGKPLQPKLSRLNPISGFKKFTSLRALIELLKSLAKLGIVAVIVYYTFRDRLGEVVMLMGLEPLGLLFAVAKLVATVWWRIALAMIVLGIIDFGYQRWQHLQELRMTHQEAKEEMKELEGDPHIKRRVRQLQRQIASQRMMADVPTADVIITNPTHYAVALRYDMENMDSPVVVAKGQRLVAQRIREIGEAHRVPIVQNPPLARTLFRTVDVGATIPGSLFRAVAEVLSFVYRVDQRAEKVRERRRFMAGAA